MCTSLEDQLRGQIKVLQDCHNQLLKKLVKEQEKNENLEVRLELLSDFTEDLTQQINRSIMAENHILTKKSDAINNLLNDLYEAIDENYTERLKNDDELAIIRAEAQLSLITNIINEIEKISTKEWYYDWWEWFFKITTTSWRIGEKTARGWR